MYHFIPSCSVKSKPVTERAYPLTRGLTVPNITRQEVLLDSRCQPEIIIIPRLCQEARRGIRVISGRWKFNYRWDECGKDDLPETLPRDWTRKSKIKSEKPITAKQLRSIDPLTTRTKCSSVMTKTQRRKEKALRRQQRISGIGSETDGANRSCQVLVASQRENNSNQQLNSQHMTPCMVEITARRKVSDNVAQSGAKSFLARLCPLRNHLPRSPSSLTQFYFSCLLFSFPSRVIISSRSQISTSNYQSFRPTFPLAIGSRLTGSKRLLSSEPLCLRPEQGGHKKMKTTLLPKNPQRIRYRSKDHDRIVNSQFKVDNYWTLTFVEAASALDNDQLLKDGSQRQNLSGEATVELAELTAVIGLEERSSARFERHDYGSFGSFYNQSQVSLTVPKRSRFEHLNNGDNIKSENSSKFSLRKRLAANNDSANQTNPLRDISNHQTRIKGRDKFRSLFHRVRDRLSKSTSHRD